MEEKMKIDKSKLKEPSNTEDNRELFAEILVNDMSIKEIRGRVKEDIIKSFRNSRTIFLREYWKYYEETWGHCPFRINSD